MSTIQIPCEKLEKIKCKILKVIKNPNESQKPKKQENQILEKTIGKITNYIKKGKGNLTEINELTKLLQRSSLHLEKLKREYVKKESKRISKKQKRYRK